MLFSTSSKKEGKKWGKSGEKVENQFHFSPFPKGSKNSILFFQVHFTKNETIHIVMMLPFGSLIAHLPRGLMQRKKFTMSGE
jgi:hypothetical protein